MTVRAKFKVESKADHAGGFSSVTLNPVTGGSEENKEFYKWSPGGEIKLNTINPTAANAFIVGKEYYVDFTLAE